jgi:hypothetical protein
MLHRFERDNRLFLRINSERPELLQIEHLRRGCHDKDVDIRHRQNGRQPPAPVQAADHRAIADIVAITQQFQRA